MRSLAGFKPVFSYSTNKLDPASHRSMWNDWLDFSNQPTASKTIQVVQAYGSDKAFSVPVDAMAVGPALRTKRFHNFAGCNYTDPSLHDKALAYGKSFKEKMTGSLGEEVSLYPNFAFGNETLKELYGEGERVEKLKALKNQWDPENVFCHYLPLADL